MLKKDLFNKYIKFIPFLIIFAVWIVFSYKYFIFGKVPFPSEYQVNFFSPWNAYQELAGPVKNNAQPDIITQIYPWRHFTVGELKQGRIPLWNPFSFSGNPHLANYQSAVLFPLNIIFFLPIDFVDGWSILVLLQPLFAGIFTFLLLRSFNVSRPAGLVSAISFMFCGFIITWLGYATLAYAILFLPLALFSINKYLFTGNKYYLPLLSLSIPLSFFSGHFQTSLYFFMVVLAFALFMLVFSKKRNFLPLLFILFGLLLSLPQLLPAIEFYSLSVRSVLYQKMEAIPWNYFPTLIAPDFYGNPVTRNDWFGHYAEWNGYVGITTLSLAFFSLFIKKKREIIFFIGLAISALLLAFDTPIINALVSLRIPVLSTSAAGRIIVLFSFAIAVLAGLSFDSIIEQALLNRRKIMIWMGSLIIFVFLLLGISYLNFLPPDKVSIARNNIILPVAIFSALILSVLGLTVFRLKRLSQVIVPVIIILVSFEMVRFAVKWQAFDPRDRVFKDIETTDFYEKGFGVDRFLGDFTAENAVYYNLQSLGGYDPLYISRYGEFVWFIADGNFSEPERSVVNFPKSGLFTSHALNLLGVKYISHKISDSNTSWGFPFEKYPAEQFEKIHDDGRYRMFINKKAQARSFMVFDVITEKDSKEILQRMFTTDLSKSAIVEEDIPKFNSGSGSTAIATYTPQEIKIKTITNTKGLLVLTDNYYPGWNVYVDGMKNNVLRVDYSFRGVVVPEGKHEVTFKYEPKSFRYGIITAVVGLIGIAIVLFKIKNHENRH